jgi:hypothetical protein
LNSIRLLLLSITSILIGCASSPSDLLKNPPDLHLFSSKDAKSVAQCIFIKWEDIPGGIATIRESKEGFRTLFFFGGELADMTEVDKLRDGSQSRFYNAIPHLLGDPWQQAVIDCQ